MTEVISSLNRKLFQGESEVAKSNSFNFDLLIQEHRGGRVYMDQIVVNSPLDMHVHLRDGRLLGAVAGFTAKSFAGAVIMPNLVPPVDSLEHLRRYRKEIESVVSGVNFEPYMTLFFRHYSLDELNAARDEIIGIKLYPEGVTTNSEGGVNSIESCFDTFQLMQDLGIPLLVHGESRGFILDRETEFLADYQLIAETFPKLKIIMEHISTAEAVSLLERFDNLFATITLHHLVITLDDVMGGLLKPHLFCKPVAKRPRDREVLRSAAFAAHPKVMFGSDSAPHLRQKKESQSSAAGVFTAPVILPLLAELFESAGALDKFQAFLSDNACRIYSISPPSRKVVLESKEWKVPEAYGELVPFYHGQLLRWGVADDEC